ncbi:hypothetical protein ACIP98_10755 [Streptomyces sp. NPDC088354]|uniref:hypothetical protein n=1 Tax=unclassified Streptomyces TaxID=2593676 RepID=UPI0029A9DEA6|nr:hypothetical protein [Streptomyces sp. MI02-7b]MDX3072410.1 hypothetical protein [Streptomyces sp. MI02-7b]
MGRNSGPRPAGDAGSQVGFGGMRGGVVGEDDDEEEDEDDEEDAGEEEEEVATAHQIR